MLLKNSFLYKEKNNIILLAILLLAFAARLYVWFDFIGKPESFIQPDTGSYLDPGMQLLKNGTFPSFSRTPVYPIFLALIKQYISANVAVTALMQIFLSVVTVWISFTLSWRIFGLLPAIICSLLVALDFQSMLTANFLLTETIFALILSIFLIKITTWSQQEKTIFSSNLLAVIVLGVWLAVLSLCRPVSFLLFIPLAFWMVLFLRKRKKKIIILVSLFCIFAISLPLAWTLRNYSKTGVCFFTTISAKDLFVYRAAWNAAFLEKKEFQDVQQAFKQRASEKQEQENWNDGELAQWERQEGIKILQKNLLVTALQGFTGWLEMYFDKTSFAELHLKKESLPSLAMISWRFFHLAFLYIGCILTFILLLKKKFSNEQQQIIYLFLIVISYFTVFSIGAETYGRFRVPIVPTLSLLAAAGWGYLLQGNRFRKCVTFQS